MFFVGENGSGKSTLLETMAVAHGFNPEGGTKNYNFSTHDMYSDLCHALSSLRGCRKNNINYQDLQGTGITEMLAFPTVIARCLIALNKPVLSSMAVLGEISIAGSMIKVDELANSLQVCLDSGTKKVLLPITFTADMGMVPSELKGSFQIIFYNSAEDAVFKALEVE